MRRLGHGHLLVLGLLSSAGCTSRETLPVELQPPPGASSGMVGLSQPGRLEIVSFETNDPRDLPFADDYERAGPLRITARYYQDTLAEMGLEAGPVPSRTNEEEFGPVPRSSAFPEDQWLDIDGGLVSEEWLKGAAVAPFSTFVSPRFPIDGEACFDLEVVGTLVPDQGSHPTRMAGLGPDLALISYASGRSERIYVAREGTGNWTATPIDPQHFLARLVSEKGNISFLSGDGAGGVLVGDCQRDGQTFTSTIWRSPSFEGPYTPFFTESLASQCPAELVPIKDDEWILRRDDGRVAWLRPVRGRLIGADFDEGLASIRMVIRGSEVFGLGPGNMVYIYRDGVFVGSELVPIEPGERVKGLSVAGGAIIAIAPKIDSGLGNQFYRRTARENWELWQSVSAQEALQITQLFDSLLMTVTFGQALQLSPREGLCPEQNDAITGVYSQTHLVALDDHTFITGGYASSSDFSQPSRVAILRARPVVPTAP